MLLATGVGAGIGAGLLMTLLHAVQSVAWGKGTGDFLDAVQGTQWKWRLAVLVLAGSVVAAAKLLLRLRKGGHGGELAAAIWFRAGQMPAFRTLANAIISIVIVGMGASLGREAAPKQTGAVLAGVLARWADLPPAQRRLLVACGAGGGIAAVYNVPFGGALFALEVLLGTVSLSLVPPALVTSAVAVATAWLILPNRPTYQIPFDPLPPALIGWSLLAGPVIGVAASGYVRLICWADAHKPKGWKVAATPLAVFALLGATSIWLPQLLGNGKDTVQAAFTDTGLPLSLLLILILAKPLATASCLGAGAPGGLFTPTLTVGAVLGLAGGHLSAVVWPGGTGPLGAYAMVGAAAMLAAATQGPLSAVILLLELTRRLDPLIVPIGLAVAGAVVMARLLESRSIYSGRIHLGRAAASLVPADTVSTAARYSEVLERLLRHPPPVLHVIDEHGEDIGTLSHADLPIDLQRGGPPEIVTARDLLLQTASRPTPR